MGFFFRWSRCGRIAFIQIYLKVWWKKSKTFNKVGWKKTPRGNKSGIHGSNLFNDAFSFFMWVIGHMKAKGSEAAIRVPWLRSSLSCARRCRILLCAATHVARRVERLSLFHRFCTKLKDDNDQIFPLFFWFWIVFWKRGEQGLMLSNHRRPLSVMADKL